MGPNSNISFNSDNTVPFRKRINSFEMESGASEEKVDDLALFSFNQSRADTHLPVKWKLSQPESLKRKSSSSENDMEEVASETLSDKVATRVKRNVSYAETNEASSLDAKYKELDRKNFPFTATLNLLGECIKKEDFSMAFELSKVIFNLFSTGNASDAQTKQAIAKFNQIIKLGNNRLEQNYYAWLRCALTWVLEQKDLTAQVKHVKEIIKGYEEAANIGSYLASCNLASYLESLGRYAEAFDQWQFCARQFPNEGRPYNQMGVLREFAGDMVEARRYYTKAYQLNLPEAASNLAKLLYETDVKTDEERDFVLALYREAGEAAQETEAGKASKALAWFNLGVIHQEGWNRTYPESQEKFYHVNYKNLKSAEECFAKACAIAPNEPEYKEALAETIFMDVSRLNSERALAALNLYGNDWIQKNPLEAIKHLEALAQFKDCQDSEYMERMACLSNLQKTNRIDQAKLRPANRVEKRDSKQKAADLMAEKGSDRKRSRELDAEVLKLKANQEPNVDKNQMEILFNQNVTTAESEIQNSSLKKSRVVVESWEKWQSKIKKLETQATEKPFDQKAHFNLAQAYLKIGEYKLAIEHFNQCDLKDALTLVSLTEAYRDWGRLDDAITCIDRAIELDPKGSHKSEKAILMALKKDPKLAHEISIQGNAVGLVSKRYIELKKLQRRKL